MCECIFGFCSSMNIRTKIERCQLGRPVSSGNIMEFVFFLQNLGHSGQ